MKAPDNKQILRLAELVKKEQGVRVAFARTNGRDCIHISKTEQKTLREGELPPGLSFTIYREAEWTYHPWNTSARRNRKDANSEVMAAVANKEAI